MNRAPDSAPAQAFVPPHPGSPQMPHWDAGELPDAPPFKWRNWTHFIGPGLVMGAASIGGGEWLQGPLVTARYGGGLLWLATLSIVGQVFYNLEISRYTLYTGEPIFTGKFRLMPGPMFWLCLYLVLDFGSVFPYLASNAATPLAAIYLNRLPTSSPEDVSLMRNISYGVFLLAMTPLIFGGKVYNSVKAVMSFKLVMVLGFLLFLAVFYSSLSTWWEIGSGFLKFGTVPIHRTEDTNSNSVVDNGESWDGRNLENVFVSLWQGRGLPPVNLVMIASISALVAVAGSGGLTNTTISNYTRDQGWGMGHHVGAIPSIIGNRRLELSHTGVVFQVTNEALSRWQRWLRHIRRDQLVIWMPACFFGLALPSMLSVQFLPRGTIVGKWEAASMTADGVSHAIGLLWGPLFWYLTLFCGFLVLGPSAAVTADGVLRRWVDVFWTGSKRLRRWNPAHIGRLYFAVLCCYVGFGLVALTFGEPSTLLEIASVFYNYALGFSCWHTLAVNLILLPKELRPGWFVRVVMALSGLFFMLMAVLATVQMLYKYELL